MRLKEWSYRVDSSWSVALFQGPTGVVVRGGGGRGLGIRLPGLSESQILATEDEFVERLDTLKVVNGEIRSEICKLRELFSRVQQGHRHTAQTHHAYSYQLTIIYKTQRCL